MTILVFGFSGQVATELRLQGGDEVTAFGHATADLNAPGTAAQAIQDHMPGVVLNAAAWTAVDKAETETGAARRLNVDAPAEIAQACARYGIPFVHVSTDYVFAGTGDMPYRETDSVAPINAYGQTKLDGETSVFAAGGNSAILRTSWVFSEHGQNFVRTMLRLAETRDRLTVVGDQIGGPTSAADIAATMLRMGKAMRDGQSGGLYHYAGAPAISWADFARAIFDKAGRAVRVEDIPTSAYPTPAARPMNSRLDCSKLHADFGITAPDWRVALDSVLLKLGATA